MSEDVSRMVLPDIPTGAEHVVRRLREQQRHIELDNGSNESRIPLGTCTCRAVGCFASAGFALLAWYGGHGVNVYDASGQEVDYFTCGDFGNNAAEPEEVEQSMARHIRNVDEIIEQAEQEGHDHGVTAGSWVLDGNSSEEAARRLLRGIEDCDPEILDALPCSPLSGEWADGVTAADVLGWYDLDEDDDAAEDVLRAFEDDFSRGVQDEAVRSARALLA